MELNGLAPGNGKVLVNGATGGVASIAIDILAQRGYHVVAMSGKASGTDLSPFSAAVLVERARLAALDPDGEADAVGPLSQVRARQTLIEQSERVRTRQYTAEHFDGRDLLLRFGADLTQTEIAEQVGVSQMQVSRLLRKSLQCLRDLTGER